jgi:DNA-binding NtrC family response regulator
LFYRLNVVGLELPPLRERADDIPLLAAHFARKAAAKHGRPTPGFTEAMLAALTSYRWPGNIRELENVIERSVVISAAPVLDVNVLPERVLSQLNSLPRPVAVPDLPPVVQPHASQPAPDAGGSVAAADAPLPDDFSFETAITDFKRELVRRALRQANGSRSEAATKLKISRQYMYRLINELQITD